MSYLANRKVGRKKEEDTVMSRIPVSLHHFLSKIGNVRNLIVKACSDQYGYIEVEKESDKNKIKNPFL